MLKLRWLLAALAVGCSGSIDSEPGSPVPSGGKARGSMMSPAAGMGGAIGMTPATDPTMPATPRPPLSPDRAAIPACAAGIQPGPSPVRRLTRLEYDNTVRDLLGTADDKLPGREFPTEEHRLGFDNNANVLTVSPLLSEQYQIGAERMVADAADRDFAGKFLASCDVATRGEEACLTQGFLGGFAKRAYRHPLSAEEIKILRDVYDIGKQQDFKAGIKLAAMVVLQSPQFLYRLEEGVAARPGENFVALKPYEMAARLSYMLWGSQPDPALVAAADANKLSTPDEIAAQVNRMLVQGVAPMVTTNAKAKRTVAHMLDQWLELEKILEVEKDAKIFPLSEFPKAHLSSMRTEVDKFLDEAFWSPDTGGTLTALYTAPYAWVDLTLYNFYGKAAGGLIGAAPLGQMMDKAAPTQRVGTDGIKRGGILTTGAVLAIQANANQTSPVLRGKFVREQLLCDILPPPPNDVQIVLPALSTSMTTRERFSKHMEAAACKGCHQLMDPIGLGFESFDSIGRYRETENGKPVDNSGDVVGMDGGKFKGVVELGKRLAGSDQAADCAARQWFRFAYGREDEKGADECAVEMLKRKFIASGLKFKDLLLALTTTDAFLYRRAGGAQ